MKGYYFVNRYRSLWVDMFGGVVELKP